VSEELLILLILFYFRYVDIVTAISSDKDRIKEIFDSFHLGIQFTSEFRDDSVFLNVTIIINNGYLEFDWHNSTFSGRYLNFLSTHPLFHKRGTVIEIVDRCFIVTSQIPRQKF